MPLDKIIVFVMAVAFFGGLIYLALKNRRSDAVAPRPVDPQQNEEDRVPAPKANQSRRKGVH